MTKAELRQRMTHAEFLEWQAYWRIEPWGAERDSDNAALIATTIANANRGKRQPFRLQDLRLRYDRRQSIAEQVSAAHKIVAAFGGTVRTRS